MPESPRTGEHNNDRGSATLEYVGLLFLVAAVVAALAVAGLPSRVVAGAEDALCRIFGGECGRAQVTTEPPLSQCVTQQDIDQHQSGYKILVFGHKDSSSTQVQMQGDGGMTVTTGKESGNGFDVKFGIGGKVGPVGWGVSVGGGVLWTGSDQTQFQYANQNQATEYQERVTKAVGAYFDKHGLDDLDGLQEIPFDIATDMGIPYTTIKANGQDAFVEANASIGFTGRDGSEVGLGASLSDEDRELLGTSDSVDAQGHLVHGDYYSYSEALAGSRGLNVSFDGVGPAGKAGVKSTDGNVLHVQYDENGNPMNLNMGNQEDSRVGPEKGAGAGLTHHVDNGDVTVTTTTVGIPEDRRAGVANALHALVDGDFGSSDWVDGATTLAELAQSPGAITTLQRYSSQTSQDNGFPINAKVGIEVLDIGSSSQHQELNLQDASIIDPATGAERPWIFCEQSAGGG